MEIVCYNTNVIKRKRDKKIMKIKDLRKPESKRVSFESLKIGQGYEDERGNICIKTSSSFSGESNCIYWDNESTQWNSSYEYEDESVFPLNIEINVLP